ncbi:MAG: hypothetical protein H7099_17890 [Gemmatimonadaceae bacterium]|nr:hypothetical protein [Gemmatimonadaceae bacterium]
MSSLVQFVCFTTVLPQEEFLVAWEPFATGFLSRGIERIVLSENTERTTEAAFDYVSRNLWDEKRFERAFPHGVRGSGGLGPIGVLQAGGFRLTESSNVDLAVGQRHDAKVIAFLMTRTGLRDKTRAAIRSGCQHPGVTASAIYLKDGDARTDRFDMVIEIYCREGSTDEIIDMLRVATAPHVTAAPVIMGAYLEVAEMGVEAKRA